MGVETPDKGIDYLETMKFEKLAIKLAKITTDIRLMGITLDFLPSPKTATDDRVALYQIDGYVGELFMKLQDIEEDLEDISGVLFSADEELMFQTSKNSSFKSSLKGGVHNINGNR